MRELLEDPEASVSGKDPPHFWVMVAALKRFVEDQGKGSLPLEVQSSPPSFFQWPNHHDLGFHEKGRLYLPVLPAWEKAFGQHSTCGE